MANVLTGTYVALTEWGALKVTITPAAAVTAGAKWQIDGGEWRESAVTVDGLTVGAHVISYREATGYTSPTTETLTISNALTTELARVYSVTPSATTAPRPAHLLSNLPYPFGFKGLGEVRDYLIKLRSKLIDTDFSVKINDIVTDGGSGFPTPSLGGIIYGDSTPKWNVLAGQITTTKKILVQTGTGTVSTPPVWETFPLPLTDPGADRIVFWDETDNILKWLACGDSIAITTTTLDTIQDIRTTAAPSFAHLHLTTADGTTPMEVTSSTEVANLNAHLLQGHHAVDFAHSDAKYIVQEVSGDLSAEQSLGALATGILKNTTTTGVGVLSIATGADLPDHSILSATHGDTTAASVVRGDIITGQGIAPKWTRLVKGTDGFFLKSGATDVEWAAVPTAAVWSSIASNPQVGEYRIKALRLDASKHIVVVYDDVPEIAIGDYETILSNPGSGQYRIKALRLDSDKHIVVVYDETPEA